jgi:phospholipid transport system transporter-binding protein
VSPAAEPAPAAFVLEAGAGGALAARGPLTFATARAARLAGLAVMAAAPSQPALVMDCAGIEGADSAGLAVLLDWLATAKASGHALRYVRLPQDFAALARISEVEGLLERGV